MRHPTLDGAEWRGDSGDQLFIIHEWKTEVFLSSISTTFGARNNSRPHCRRPVVPSFIGLRIPDGPVPPYLSPRPTLSRARRTEIIPRIGLERRVEKIRTWFRRAGCKKPRCFSWSFSCSGSGSSLPLHHNPVAESRYSVMSKGTSAQNSAALPRLPDTCTPLLSVQRTDAPETAGEMRVSGRGTEGRRGGSVGERMSTFPVFSQWLNAVKVAQLVWKVSCSVRRVGVSLRSGGVSEQREEKVRGWRMSNLSSPSPLHPIQSSSSSVEIYKSPHPAESAWSLSHPIIKGAKDTDDLWDVFTVTSRAPKTVTYWATQRLLQSGRVLIRDSRDKWL